MSLDKLDTTPLRRPGRPRSAECDGAILDAAWRLLGEVGYMRLSMERIAAEANVGKPTLYLRYSSKAEVVAAAFLRHRIDRAPRPAGDLRADIAAQLDHIREVMDGVGMCLVGTCLMEEEHAPDLIALLRERSLRPGRQILRDLLEAARERGEIGAGADVEVAITMAIGSFYATRIAGDAFPPDWAERVADATVRALRGP